MFVAELPVGLELVLVLAFIDALVLSPGGAEGIDQSHNANAPKLKVPIAIGAAAPVGLIRAMLAIDKLRNARGGVPEAAASLLSESIANQTEALTVFTKAAMPEGQAFARLMLGMVLFLSTDTVNGEEKSQRLSKALENLDIAAKIIYQPVPTTCQCSPALWSQLQSMLAALYAGIGTEIGGEQGARLLGQAVALSEETFSRATDKPSRAMWANAQSMTGISLLWQRETNGQFNISNVRAAITFLEKAIARISREELPLEWAKLERVLASGYLKLGDLSGADGARNFDAAVTAYEQVSDVFAKKGPPAEWADSQLELGKALTHSAAQISDGGRVAKLNRAINIFEELIKVYKGKENSYVWALAHLRLGIALWELGRRVAGAEGAVKLLQAVTALEKSLTFFTPKMQADWAYAQDVLGSVHAELAYPFGQDPVKHLTSAVKAFEEERAVVTSDDPRELWAAIRAKEGVALYALGKIPGPDAESHLTRAVKAYEDALTIFNEKDSRPQWVLIQKNLGFAFLALGLTFERNRESNLLAAITAFGKALTVVSDKESVKEWAEIQDATGMARLNLGTSFERNSEANLLESVQAFEKALTVYNEKVSPRQWAQTQGNLGWALLNLGRLFERDHERHLRQALKAFEKALTIYTENDAPELWAQTQVYLGRTLHLLTQTDQADWETHLTDSITAFRRALKILTVKGPPPFLAQTQADLGWALTTLGRSMGPEGVQPLTDAIETFDQALAIYTGKQFQRERAQAQLNRGETLLSLGGLLQGVERSRRFSEAAAAAEEALGTFKVDSFPGEWAEATNILAEAWQGLDRPQEAAKGFAQVLAVDPANGRALSGLNYINHEIFFNYDEAFRLQQQWARAYPDMLEVQADFAEKHFTTERFAECQRMIASLLQRQGLDASIEVALRAIEIANLLAQGKSKSIDSKMALLIDVVRAQPGEFRVNWIFNGTIHFIGNNKKFAKRRTWLLQVFEAVKLADRDAIDNELKKVRAGFIE